MKLVIRNEGRSQTLKIPRFTDSQYPGNRTGSCLHRGVRRERVIGDETVRMSRRQVIDRQTDRHAHTLVCSRKSHSVTEVPGGTAMSACP